MASAGLGQNPNVSQLAGAVPQVSAAQQVSRSQGSVNVISGYRIAFGTRVETYHNALKYTSNQ